jgi:demethylmenaquinone methyltransferase/2-methoxy-6-polyprenyl-1,4-benzoquinol methylase
MNEAMTKEKITAFFNECASWWDDHIIRNEEAIKRILDNAHVEEGAKVLDVACGTGVLFDDYLVRGVCHVTAVDISPEMVKKAKMNYNDERIEVICGDIEEFECGAEYDVCMVYNAFPHFPDPEKLISKLAALIKPGGRLSIAHGMSAAQLKEHHSRRASNVSLDLPGTDVIAKMMEKNGVIADCRISDDMMFQVAGMKLEEQ